MIVTIAIIIAITCIACIVMIREFRKNFGIEMKKMRESIITMNKSRQDLYMRSLMIQDSLDEMDELIEDMEFVAKNIDKAYEEDAINISNIRAIVDATNRMRHHEKLAKSALDALNDIQNKDKSLVKNNCSQSS